MTQQFVRGTSMGGGIGGILYSGLDSPGRKHFVYNAIGSTVATVSGFWPLVVESTSDYEAFGNVVAATGATDNDRLFCTKERSATIGLDNFGMRYYDPVLGRFLTRDPAGYPDGPNNYLYCNNNPINHIDPLGLATPDPSDPYDGVDIYTWASWGCGPSSVNWKGNSSGPSGGGGGASRGGSGASRGGTGAPSGGGGFFSRLFGGGGKAQGGVLPNAAPKTSTTPSNTKGIENPGTA